MATMGSHAEAHDGSSSYFSICLRWESTTSRNDRVPQHDARSHLVDSRPSFRIPVSKRTQKSDRRRETRPAILTGSNRGPATPDSCDWSIKLSRSSQHDRPRMDLCGIRVDVWRRPLDGFQSVGFRLGTRKAAIRPVRRDGPASYSIAIDSRV